MKLLTYTSVTGNYEELGEQHRVEGIPDRYVCFTDRRRREVEPWMQFIPNQISELDSRRASRYCKMLGPFVLDPDFSIALYIDNSVELRSDPRELATHLLGSKDIGFVPHPRRLTVESEFFACLGQRMDDRRTIKRQLAAYRRDDAGCLKSRPLCGGLFAWRLNQETLRFMELWMSQVSLFSSRDQLSLVYALRRTGLTPNLLDIDIHKSPWHVWPVPRGRQPRKTRRDPIAAYYRVRERRVRPF